MEDQAAESMAFLLNYGVLGIIAIVFFFGLYYIMKMNKMDKDALMDIINKKDESILKVIQEKDEIIQANVRQFNETVLELHIAIGELTRYIKQNKHETSRN